MGSRLFVGVDGEWRRIARRRTTLRQRQPLRNLTKPTRARLFPSARKNAVVSDVKGFLFSKKFNLGDTCAYSIVGKDNGVLGDLRPGQRVTVGYQDANVFAFVAFLPPLWHLSSPLWHRLSGNRLCGLHAFVALLLFLRVKISSCTLELEYVVLRAHQHNESEPGTGGLIVRLDSTTLGAVSGA